MPDNSPRLAIPRPLGQETVSRLKVWDWLNAVDANAATVAQMVAHQISNPADHVDRSVTGVKVALATVKLENLHAEVMDAVAQGATSFAAARATVGTVVNNNGIPTRANRFSVAIKNLHATATIEAVAQGGAFGTGWPIGPGESASFQTKAAIALISDTAATPYAYSEDYS